MRQTLAKRLVELERTSRFRLREVRRVSGSDAIARLSARVDELAASPEVLRQWEEMPDAEKFRRVQEVREALRERAYGGRHSAVPGGSRW
jgi:hypothetical protein